MAKYIHTTKTFFKIENQCRYLLSVKKELKSMLFQAESADFSADF